MLGGFGAYASAQAGAIEVRSAQLEADRNGWALDAHFYFTLNEHLAEAVNKGIPLYFTTGFTLTRARWYWFDERAVSVERSVRLAYQPLTRQYRISSGGLHFGLPTLTEALAVIQRLSGWHVIDRRAVHPGARYTASVRMILDTALMPKPFQINAINDRDWKLVSDWKSFDFKPSAFN
ncbi:conserved hypothetical protein [Candidatus Glomeribacter gigasporarum BEG34]|uniref:Proline rich signal peptide protein n=1 Tax=Candidatus Glomeribacter gigasporarum BEG34 TaxID=1070319 RepID=G2J9Y6_9BURK|nr:DUF4390 domain-containing protein [Candidatus Glomeribacter gigasporarum]CCD29583.1 conserved hypothetical protein [Candidatus Glomeribacter gigasporarum BEG34]